MTNKIKDYATGKLVDIDKPEEIRRQEFEKILVNKYNYPKEHIDIEVKIQMGVKRKRADIVVFRDETKSTPLIICEIKKEKRKDGLGQLQSYMSATGVEIGAWYNGRDTVFLFRKKPNLFLPLKRLPYKGENVNEIKEIITRGELEPIDDLLAIFKESEQYILANQTVDVFDELFKVIFTKLYDEKTNLKNDSSECVFRADLINEKPSDVARRIKRLFDEAKKKWKEIFKPNEEIELNDENLAYVVAKFQSYYLLKSNSDVLGVAFETLINPQMKGDKGQFFTPRQVVECAVRGIDPEEEDLIIDPACGSGGFLIYSLDHVWEKISKEWQDKKEALEHKIDFAGSNVYGIDDYEKLVKVAKAYMLIWGDGRSNIYNLNSLKKYVWSDEHKRKLKNEKFSVVLTNPPFAGSITSEKILKHHGLGFKNGKLLKSQKRDILFIDVCLDFLEEGGRMAIVLPTPDLANSSLNYVQEYIKERAKIISIVGLPKDTFRPHTSQKTSLVFLEKRNNPPKNYKILMIVSNRCGKNQKGSPIYKTKDRKIILDDKGKAIIDTDLYDIGDLIRDFRLGNLSENELKKKYPNVEFSIVSSKDLNDRLDSEFYRPFYLELKEKLEKTKIPLFELKDLVKTKITSGATPLIDKEYLYYTTRDVGIPFLRVRDLEEGYINLQDVKYIYKDVHDKMLKRSKLKPNDVLLSIAGTIGLSTVVPEDLKEANINQALARIRLKESIKVNSRLIKIDPYYISAFLNSYFGKIQTERLSRPGAQANINLTETESILIPIVDYQKQKEIGRKFKESIEMKKESKTRLIENNKTLMKII